MIVDGAIRETLGKFPNATIEVIDEATHARLRIREGGFTPVCKASITMTSSELLELAAWITGMAKYLRDRGL